MYEGSGNASLATLLGTTVAGAVEESTGSRRGRRENGKRFFWRCASFMIS